MLRRTLCIVLMIATSAAGQKGADTRSWGPPALPVAGASVRPIASAVVEHAFDFAAAGGDGVAVSWDSARIAAAAARPGVIIIRGFPIDAGVAVDLEVERFWVTQPGTRFVAAGQDGADVPLNFDPASVVLLRGRVSGNARSTVYLGLALGMSQGVIDLGPGQGSYGIAAHPSLRGALTVFRSQSAGGRTAYPFCLVERPSVEGPGAADGEPRRGLRQLQLASETDNAFFRLFGDSTAAAIYLVQLYGAVSDIYMRELNIRIDLVYARVWPQANEPFGASLSAFQAYWNANMGSVQRDAAQMLSGRAELPGGVAYVSALCGGSAYGFCGNALGYFADPRTSSVINYDPMVTAHELGHVCGTLHTQDYGLDHCDQVAATPQRGTIMSYCNQTISGAQSVIDMGFHKVTRNAVFQHVASVSCIAFDCNQNGVPDTLDIAAGTSRDANSNGIPDECEDCNHNGRLDSLDIGLGSSTDLNANGIPDECEPDCNANLIPDDRDIALGLSQDLHGDGIPDECDADLNGNGISDYNEIWSNMTLDKNRNRTLDSREDCDQDGTPDLTALQGAGDAWAASLATTNMIQEYHAITGVLMSQSPANAVSAAQDLVITPTRRILVSSASTNNVLEFTRVGAPVGVLVPTGSGGLSNPGQMLLTGSGTLLVASRGNNAVLEFNLTTGAFVRQFVASGAGGMASPFGLAWGPSGNLFVSAGPGDQVFEFNGVSGAFVRIMVPAAANGGLSGARGLLFNADGTLLVASFNTDQVKQYDGTTGAFIRDWLVTGLPVDGPWCLRRGRDGMVYISRNLDPADTHLTRARIFIFDPRNGNFVRAYVQGLDAQLSQPTGFDFMPWNLTDCNGNMIPDPCDVSSGRSGDLNANGIPDECERACYANCDLSTTPPVLNVLDFACFLNEFAAGRAYANCDGSQTAPVLNVLDFGCFLNRFAAGCP